ncbi:hypothetical protein [Bdellovibrio sp. BCCA]|uniref:hypothetical protein n=1 Tax=Bdellovibrio sp. BCCA TaxID=3136281 RepID=UPI0030F28C1E
MKKLIMATFVFLFASASIAQDSMSERTNDVNQTPNPYVQDKQTAKGTTKQKRISKKDRWEESDYSTQEQRDRRNMNNTRDTNTNTNTNSTDDSRSY